MIAKRVIAALAITAATVGFTAPAVARASGPGVAGRAATSAASLAPVAMAAAAPAGASGAPIGVVHSAIAGRTSGRSAAGEASRFAAPSVQRIVLITGDVVLLTTAPDGRQQAAVAHHATTGAGAQFQTFNRGSDLYVVPASALPYLGRTLDPSLFDVTALGRSGHPTQYRVAVRSAPGRTHAALAGIRLRSTGSDASTGGVDAATGPTFGRALARQAVRDRSSGRYGGGLFAGISSISVLPGPARADGRRSSPATTGRGIHRTPSAGGSAASVARSVSPDFPMYTVSLKGIDAAGAPDSGDSIEIINLDDLRRYNGFPFFNKGLAKVSLPAGHYRVLVSFVDFTSNFTLRTVLSPEFTVSGNRSLRIDARSANAKVRMTTPRPATVLEKDMTLAIGDARGQLFTSGFAVDGPSTMYVSPTTAPPSIGVLHYYVDEQAASPVGAPASYTYSLKYPSDGVIPAHQTYVATGANLAHRAATIDGDGSHRSSMASELSALPWEDFLFALLDPVSTPLARTEYYSANSQLAWQYDLISEVNQATFDFEGEYTETWRTFAPGAAPATHWLHQPLHPRAVEGPISPGETICPVCISGTTAEVFVFPFGDNQIDHYGFPAAPAPGNTERTTWDVKADSTTIASGTDFLQGQVAVPTAAKTLRLDYRTERAGKNFALSTRTATSWFLPVDSATQPLPPGWLCTDATGSRSCAVLPALTSSYALPTSSSGALAPGARRGTVTIGHLSGAPALALKSIVVSDSFDGGAWKPVRLRSTGAGSYQMSLRVPASAHTASLQIHAVDAAGSGITQAITNAFAVTG